MGRGKLLWLRVKRNLEIQKHKMKEPRVVWKGKKQSENKDFWDRSEQMEKWSCRKANWEAA